MDNWNENFEEVDIALSDGIIRVDDGIKLKKKMQKNFPFALKIASYILVKYQEMFGKPLHISLKSLAIEIYVHFLFQEFFLKMERIFGKNKLSDKMILHTSVIDCGERKLDSNRFIWDFMSVFYIKKIEEIKKVGAE